MHFMEKQTSVNRSVKVEGVNVYNGRANYAIFHPAEADTGLVFRTKEGEIPARLEHAYNGKRAIWLSDGKTEVGLTEHLLSGVYGAGVDNLVIELSDGVCPTVDNCAKEYFLALRDAIANQDVPRTYWRAKKGIEWTVEGVQKGDNTSITVRPSQNFAIDYSIGFPHKAIGNQRAKLVVNLENYAKEIMDCRSPGFLPAGIPWGLFLLAGKLGFHGITGKNYLLVGSKDSADYKNPAGYGVRHEGKEAVGHKILDFLGTLALTGKPFKQTEFVLSRSGHKFDLSTLKQLFNEGCFEKAI